MSIYSTIQQQKKIVSEVKMLLTLSVLYSFICGCCKTATLYFERAFGSACILLWTWQLAVRAVTERKRKRGRERSAERYGNLQEDSHGPAAADHTPPELSKTSPTQLLLLKKKKKFFHCTILQFCLSFRGISSSFFFFFFFASLPRAARSRPDSRRLAGETASWLGRTETPAAARRGRNRSTTSRRSLILKKSSERE